MNMNLTLAWAADLCRVICWALSFGATWLVRMKSSIHLSPSDLSIDPYIQLTTYASVLQETCLHKCILACSHHAYMQMHADSKILLGGPWVVIGRVIGRVAITIAMVTALLSLLVTSPGPPSIL